MNLPRKGEPCLGCERTTTHTAACPAAFQDERPVECPDCDLELPTAAHVERHARACPERAGRVPIPPGWTYARFAEVSARVAVWDQGKPVWTLELGGLGPGYEQAIQVAVIELLRDALQQPLPTAEDDVGRLLMQAWGEATLPRIDRGVGGLSGAQWSAARWLAYQLASRGWQDLKRRAETKGEGERIVQVSTHWPQVPSPAGRGSLAVVSR